MSVRGHLIAAAAAFTLLAGAAHAADSDAPVAETLGAWPCLDAPGCGGSGSEASVVAAPAPYLSASEPAVIPLPAALALLGAGLTGLAMIGRRR